MTDVEITPQADEHLEGLDSEVRERVLILPAVTSRQHSPPRVANISTYVQPAV
jgi:hypothetical protein